MAETKLRLQIDGMHCAACATRIEKVLSRKPAIASAEVNFASEEAQVVYDAKTTTPQEIVTWIDKTGYSAKPIEDDALPDFSAKQGLPWRLVAVLLCAAPFLMQMLGELAGSHWRLPAWLQFLLASIVALYLAIPFYQGAWASLRGRLANMDVLVSLGSGAIYLYSAAVFLSGHAGKLPTYFEAGVLVVAFVSFGKYLETRGKRDTLNSLSLLLQMTPETVTRYQAGKAEPVALKNVQIGDELQASQGERVAADGVLLSGKIACDESHLTGESEQLTKEVGDKVLAGALVTQGSAHYQVSQLGSQTLLGDMMQALSQAQGSKAPLARIADKVANVFVPLVVVIALLTFAVSWGISGSAITGMLHAVAVLVIACPCALGLATPAAIMAGMGQAVAHGVWFKDAASLEAASHIDVVVFDKTGTLTIGAPQVLDTLDLGKNPQWLIAAASVEQSAIHPLAKAILQYVDSENLLSATAVNSEVGGGISAQIEGIGEVRVGSASFLQVEINEDFLQRNPSASFVGVSINHEVCGWFALGDAIREETPSALQKLRHLGITPILMSGDNRTVVKSVAEQLGIEDARAELSPRDKLSGIEALMQQGKRVAMVGDGVNDAPALAAASVSFAIKGGAKVAEAAANATLMRKNLLELTQAFSIAKATVHNIHQNLFFALIYNLIGIPLAALGILSPVIAGAAMALSSISVLLNALRLKWKTFQ